MWLELSIPICGFTFATGTYLTGVLKYLRRFTGRIATKWLAHLLAMPEKTRGMSKSEYKNGILKRNTPNDEQRKAGTAIP